MGPFELSLFEDYIGNADLTENTLRKKLMTLRHTSGKKESKQRQNMFAAVITVNVSSESLSLCRRKWH